MHKRAVSVLLGSALLVGCAATPDYEPQQEANERYLDSLSFGVQSTDATTAEWWKSYEDDQLNQLVEVAKASICWQPGNGSVRRLRTWVRTRNGCSLRAE